MKKVLISITMVIALICMQLPTTILAVTDETTSFLLNENFDSWDGDVNSIKNAQSNLNINITKDAGITNDPTKGALKISNKDSGNVKFQMQPKNSSNNILYPDSTLVFSADFYMEDYESQRKVYYYGGPSSDKGEVYRGALIVFEKTQFEEKYWIRAYWGDNEKANYNRIKYLMPYELDTWYHVDLVLNLESGTYDVYINGTKFEIGHFPHDGSGTGASFIESLYLNRLMIQGAGQATENGVAYVDNVYMAPVADVSSDRYAAKSDIAEKSGKIGYATTFDIDVSFDNAADSSTYEACAVTLTGGEEDIDLIPEWNGDAKGFTVTISENSLAPSTAYSLVISDLKDVLGNTFTSDISFETASTAIDYLEPPVIAISAPSAANKGETVEVSVESIEVNDGGSITSVEYFDNGEKIGEVTEEPYNYTINSIGAGSHSITAVVNTSVGICGESNAVEINVADALVTILTPTFRNGASESAILEDGVINYILSDSEKAQMANGADFSFEIDYKIPATRPRIFMGLSNHDATAYYKEATCYALLNQSTFKFRDVDETTGWTITNASGGIFAADTGSNVKVAVNINYLKGTYGVSVYVNNSLRKNYEYSLGEKFASSGSLSKITEITSFDFKFDKADIETVNSVSAKIVVPRPAVNSVVFKDTIAGTQTENAGEISKDTDEIAVTFTENMFEESFTESSVTLTDENGTPVAFTGNYNKDEKTYTLDLSEALDYGKTYVLTLSEDIMSMALVSMSDVKTVTFKTPANKYKITGVPVVNGKQVSYGAVFKNNTSSAQDAIVILAAYNSDGKLIGSAFDKENVKAKSEWDDIALLFTAEETVDSVKIFVWESFLTMKPLIAVK